MPGTVSTWKAAASAAMALGLPLVPIACDDEAIENPGPPTKETPPPIQESGAPPVDDDGGDLGVGVERTGTQPELVVLDLPTGGTHMVTLTFTGSGFFQASIVDDQEEFLGRLGTSSEDFAGTYLLEVGRDGDPGAVDISDVEGGTWTVLVESIEQAPLWPDVTEGAGTTVLQIDQARAGGGTAVTGSHDGEANFIVWSYGDGPSANSLLYNEIGAVDGPSGEEVRDGAFVIAVDADGAWTLAPT